jgi:uncharacterized integral membrane protein
MFWCWNLRNICNSNVGLLMARSGVDVNAAHVVLSDNGTLVANTLSSCTLSCFAVCVSWVFFKASRKRASAPNCTSSHTIYLSQIFITFVILQFCNIPRLLSISAMMRKLKRHKQQSNLDYTMIVCLPQVCHCLIIQHVLHLRPLQNVPIRSPTLLLQMFILAVRKWHKLFKIP